MKAITVTIATVLLAVSTGASAWNMPRGFGGASANAHQFANGRNNASAISMTTGNGYSSNSAGSATQVNGATNAYAYRGRSGWVSGASAYDSKSINTYSRSLNLGSGFGAGFSSGSAYGGAWESSNAWD